MNPVTRKTGTSQRLTRWGIPTAIAMLGLSATALADSTRGYYETELVRWPVANGGNDHLYAVVQDTATCEICWDEAQATASSRGGYLATITSAAEVAFVVTSLGPLVLSHPNPAFGWGGGTHLGGNNGEWITGELWEYMNWGIINGQPSGDGPHFTIGGPNADAPDTPGMWNDIGGGDGCHTSCLNNYTIEWSADCNGDGIVDYGQILDGTYADHDSNGVPDCCDAGEPCVVAGPDLTVDDDLLDYPDAIFTSIQAAIDAAQDGDLILVYPGTYTGTGTRVIDLLGKPITIRATGTAEETIIDGEGARGVVRCNSGEGADTIIEGFTITGGSTDVGGGIYCYNSNPTITGCTISNNTTTGGSITNNGGGVYCKYSDPAFTDCTISDNTASNAGGIYTSYSSPTITGCTISNNTANWDCGFDGCGGRGGGGYDYYGGPAFTDCTISSNSAYNGGGYASHLQSSSATFTGCTLSYNIAHGDIYATNGGIECDTCIITDTVICENDPNSGEYINGGGNTYGLCPPDCPDVNGDGSIAVHDLLAVLEAWGSDDPDADVDGDGIVGMDDLEAVITNWGPCP